MLGAAVAAVVVLGMPPAAAGAPVTPAVAGDFTITDERITESSGLALSARHPYTVWTTNDSGDSARVFAVDTRTGSTTGVHDFDAEVRDVEALAMTPGGRLLVGDIGDNDRQRESIVVYSFEEPPLGETDGGWIGWELTYPDGPHDAEALAVDPETGRVLVVTKDEENAGIYALPEDPSTEEPNELERVGDTSPGVTDAVYLADGSALMVRTYAAVLTLDTASWTATAGAWLPVQPQGETLALAPDETGLLAGTEGVQSKVLAVPVPKRVTPKPSGTMTGFATAIPQTEPPVSPTRAVPGADDRETAAATPPTDGEPSSDPWADLPAPVWYLLLGVAVLLLMTAVLVPAVVLRRRSRRGAHQ